HRHIHTLSHTHTHTCCADCSSSMRCCRMTLSACLLCLRICLRTASIASASSALCLSFKVSPNRLSGFCCNMAYSVASRSRTLWKNNTYTHTHTHTHTHKHTQMNTMMREGLLSYDCVGFY